MIAELDTVVLNHDVKDHGLKEGDIGAVVHTDKKNNFLEVEFLTFEGKTIAQLSLNKKDVRPIKGKEILHVRDIKKIAA